MPGLKQRPLVCIAGCYGVGLAVGCVCHSFGWYFIAGALIALLAFPFVRRRGCLFAAALLVGAGTLALSVQAPELPENGKYHLSAVVRTAQTDSEGRCRWLLEDAELNGCPVPGRMLAYVQAWQNPLPKRGDRVEMTAYVYPAADSGSISPFSWRGYTLKMRIWLGASGTADTVVITETGKWSLRRALDGVREELGRRIEEMYTCDIAQLVKGLTLGVRDELPVEISDAFTAAGVVHLLALSGLHVSLLAALLDFLLRRTPLPAGGAFGIVLCALGMYAMMVGAPASILRAVIMYAIAGIGRLRQRPRDTLTSLAAAFLALTLFSPTRVLDAGLLLSFASIFGMLCLTPSVEWFRFPMLPEKAAAACGYLCQTFLASLGATLATLPIVAILYEKVHLYGLLANMILVPMASAALPLAFLSVLLGAVHVWLGIPFAALAEWILKAVIWLAKQVELWPGAALYVRGWNGWLIPGFYAAVFLSSPYMHSPHKSGVFRGVLLASAMGIAAAALGIPAMTASPLTICFLDAGQADSAVVRMEDRVYVVDAGMDDVCAAYLKDRGLQVDGLFLTHPHDDHAGGAEMVLYTHCGTLYVPDNWHRMQADGELQQIPALAQELGWEVCYLAAGDGVDLGGGAQIRVLWPEEGLRETNANKGSMVLWLQYGEGDALFLADKTAGLEFPLPGAELVKVAHHGGVDGTDKITAQAVSPVLAVIPVGANSYGHPNEKTIALWEECGAKVLRTDRDGNVLVDLYEDGSMQYQVHPD